MQLEVLQHIHAHHDGGGNLDARTAQLAVAHGRVHVAHLQQRPGHAHGEVQAGALGDEVVVHVAAMGPHVAVDHIVAGRRRADHADHGVDGEAHAIEGGHAVFHRHLARAVGRALEQRAAVVVGGHGALVGHADVVDVHHEHIAWLGPFHEHGASGGVGPVVAVIQHVHGDRLVGDAVGEAVKGVELEHLARHGRGRRGVVLGKRVHLILDDLHGKLPSGWGGDKGRQGKRR